MKKENLIKFYQTYKIFIFPAIVALSSLILIIFVIYPQTIKLIQGIDVEENLNARSQILEAKAETLERYDEEDLQHKVSSVMLSFPPDRDFAEILGILQNLIESSGFNTASMTLGQNPVESNQAKSYIVKAEILGPRILLPVLVQNIESHIRIMKIHSVESTTSLDSQSVSVVLGVEVFYLPIPQTLGSIDSPLPELTEKDEELIARLAQNQLVTTPQIPTTLGPRGKANPFE